MAIVCIGSCNLGSQTSSTPNNASASGSVFQQTDDSAFKFTPRPCDVSCRPAALSKIGKLEHEHAGSTSRVADVAMKLAP